jgi:hypothetical protein
MVSSCFDISGYQKEMRGGNIQPRFFGIRKIKIDGRDAGKRNELKQGSRAVFSQYFFVYQEALGKDT